MRWPPAYLVVTWAVAGVVVIAALWLTFESGCWWLWVANSAFRGIGGPRDTSLGIIATVAALAPVVTAVAAVAVSRRSRPLEDVVACGGATTLVVALAATFFAAMLTFPF